VSGLGALFSPRSVAVLGASDNPARVGGRPLQGMRIAGFSGAVYPVNPRYEETQGYRCYPNLQAIPEAIDLALVALPAHAVADAVAACAARSVRAVTIFSSGFAEAGPAGALLERRVSATASAAGMRILGPNCMGTMHPALGFIGTFTSTLGTTAPEPGPVSIASQSGAFAAHVFTMLRRLAIGIDLWAATGNQADVDLAECIEHMAGSAATRVIVVCVEGVRDGARFARALALAREHGKAVVAMKLGSSALGASAVESHTAVLAGSDAVFGAVLRAHGAWRADTMDDLVGLAYALSFERAPRDRTLVVASVSGGFGALLADAADATGMALPALPPATQSHLRGLVPFAATRNPLDLTAQFINDPGVIEPMLDRVLTDTTPGCFVLYIGASGEIPELVARLLPALERLAARHREQLIVLCALTAREHRVALQRAGYLVVEDPHRALAACAALADRAARQRTTPASTWSPVCGASVTPALPWRDGPNEAQAKAWLGAAGIPVLPSRVAGSADEAVATARALGFPVAMKILSASVAHKSDIEGVLLDVADDADVVRAFARLQASALAHGVAPLDGVLLEPMVRGGVEMIVGTRTDPVFGPVVTVGFGGIFVDTLRDFALAPAPVSAEQAADLIRGLDGYPILAGARGNPLDVACLAEVVAQVSSLAWRSREVIESIEINPFVVRAQGGVALDALVLPRSPAAVRFHTEEHG